MFVLLNDFVTQFDLLDNIMSLQTCITDAVYINKLHTILSIECRMFFQVLRGKL